MREFILILHSHKSESICEFVSLCYFVFMEGILFLMGPSHDPSRWSFFVLAIILFINDSFFQLLRFLFLIVSSQFAVTREDTPSFIIMLLRTVFCYIKWLVMFNIPC